MKITRKITSKFKMVMEANSFYIIASYLYKLQKFSGCVKALIFMYIGLVEYQCCWISLDTVLENNIK